MVKHSGPPSGSKVTQREGKVKRRRDGCQTRTRHTERARVFRPVSSASPVTCETWSSTTCWSQLASLPVSSSLRPPSSISRLTFTSQLGKKVNLFHTSSILPFLCWLCSLTAGGFDSHLIAYVFSDLPLHLTSDMFLVNFSFSRSDHLFRFSVNTKEQTSKFRRLCGVIVEIMSMW